MCSYKQYIIEYCAPASNEGLAFVGHRGDSWTTHVFWVNQNEAADFEKALAVIGFVAEEAENEPEENELGA